MRVLATCRLPGDAQERLGREVDLVIGDGIPADVTAADGIIVLLTETVDAALLSRAPRLRVVGNYAVGLNNIDVAEATRRGIAVVNTPDVLTEATADLTFALLLAAARRLVEGDAIMRAGRFGGWRPDFMLGRDVHGATLGLVGYGRIARAVERRAAGFGMRVIWTSRSGGIGLGELLAQSDFLSLHVPLTDKTRHMIGAPELARMRPGSVLLNVSRGPVVDEAALARALRYGPLAAAGLDVYENEPAVHPDLVGLPNVVLAPHIGSATIEARSAMARLVCDGVAAVLRGERPPNLVNPAALDQRLA